MLQALYEHGIMPDLLVGASAGALNAAYVASRPQSAATAKDLGRIWRDLHREDIFPISMSALVGGACGRRDHLVPDRGLRQLVRRYIEFDDLADAPIPLHLIAFNLTEGHEMLLSDGPAVDAVAASAAIPGVFPPVTIAQQRLIDGGVVNNSPISHAVELGAEKIYVLATQHPGRPAERVPKTALDAAIYGLGLLSSSRLEADIARYSQEVEVIVLPAPNAAGVQPTSFEHSTRLMSEARDAARTLAVSSGVSYRYRRHIPTLVTGLLTTVVSAWTIVASLVFSPSTVQNLGARQRVGDQRTRDRGRYRARARGRAVPHALAPGQGRARVRPHRRCLGPDQPTISDHQKGP